MMPPSLLSAFAESRQRTVQEGTEMLATALTDYGERLFRRMTADPYMTQESLSFMLRRESNDVRSAVFALLLAGAQLGVQEARAELETVGIVASPLAIAECVTWADTFSFSLLNGFYTKTIQGIQDAIAQWSREQGELQSHKPWPYLFSAQRAGALATTETTRAVAQSKWRMYRSAGVMAYTVDGALKSECVCSNFTGHNFDISSGVLPPFHPWCSCRIYLT